MAGPFKSHAVDPCVIAARLRSERIRLRLTQEGVASLLGVSRGTYRQLERRANPQLATLLALADVGFDLRRVVPELFVV